MEILQQKIAYQFKNKTLLQKALTHKSADKDHNERLEFLGDSILGAIIAKQLYQQFSDLDEGYLTHLRAQLVNGNTLCKLAKRLSLSEYLHLGKGMRTSGGVKQCSVLEDAFEALIGAIFLDAGFKTAQRVILAIYAPDLQALKPEIEKDAKTQLQECLQKYQYPLPHYHLLKTSGQAHRAIFTVSCTLDKPAFKTIQEGHSIKQAEQICAAVILKKIKKITSNACHGK